MTELTSADEYKLLVDLIKWIDDKTKNIELPTDERSMLAEGCFDVVVEHQAAVALLFQAGLHGSMFALLRTMTEGLVRGLWLLLRATNDDIARFKRGKVNQTFAQLITELEEKLGPANSSLQNIKHATNTFHDFTHTGFAQVSRRHSRGELKGSYPDAELKKALAFTGAMGMIAAAQLSAMSTATATLSPKFSERMKEYAARSKLAG